MKYLNENIEEIGKRANEKSLVNDSLSYDIFQNLDCKSMTLKNYIQQNKM